MEVEVCGKKVEWRVYGIGMKDVHLCNRHVGTKGISGLIRKGILGKVGSFDEAAGCEAEIASGKKKEGATREEEVR